MAISFYSQAVSANSMATPFAQAGSGKDPNTGKLTTQEMRETILSENAGEYKLKFYDSAANYRIKVPKSIMNEHVGVNYRTIYNGWATQDKADKNFTLYDDYLRCTSNKNFFAQYLQDKRNPTYKNIIKYYNDSSFDPHGMARYKIQDFIYLKYYNQIPNNYMVTLRRYAQPINDGIFGLDYGGETMSEFHGFKDNFYALATGVTYLGEKAGNKLSEILHFDYGANWENKTAQVNQLQSSDGGLKAQLKQWGVKHEVVSGTAGLTNVKQSLLMGAMAGFTGIGAAEMQASQHQYPENAFIAQYGEEFYGDINSIVETSMRSRGLTFNNSFSLNFEYSLKSLKCVNPRVAMMDILSNFLLLTGNYGSFWGGATIWNGVRNIAPQFGNPKLLREGKYSEYLNSLYDSATWSWDGFVENIKKHNDGEFNIGSAIKKVLTGGLEALLGNLLGGNIGHAGEAQAPPALLTGAPTGFWHLTIGNPLDPIAMMGNMKIEKTTVTFNDVLGYDDFPTEIKFTVELSHAKPRDNSGIESMFNGNKGRFYVLSREIESTFNINYEKAGAVPGQTNANSNTTQEYGEGHNGKDYSSGPFSDGALSVIGGILGH